MPSPIEHLARPEPSVGFDRALRDVCEDGVRTTEGDDRRLAEEHPFLEEHAVRADRRGDGPERKEP
jgi:hypothetical protein